VRAGDALLGKLYHCQPGSRRQRFDIDGEATLR